MMPRTCTDIVTHIVTSCRPRPRPRPRRCRKSSNSMACIHVGISFLLIRLAHGLMLASLAT